MTTAKFVNGKEVEVGVSRSWKFEHRTEDPWGTGTFTEQYIIERDKPFDSVIFGLAHTQPRVLSELIEQLRAQTRFVNHVADSLNAAIIIKTIDRDF